MAETTAERIARLSGRTPTGEDTAARIARLTSQGSATATAQETGQPPEPGAWLGFKEPLKAGLETAKGAIAQMAESKRAQEAGEISYPERLLRSGAGALNLVVGAPGAAAYKAVEQGVNAATGGVAGRVAGAINKPIEKVLQTETAQKAGAKVGEALESRTGKNISAAANIALTAYPTAKAIIPKTGGALSAVKKSVSDKLMKAGISTEKRALAFNPTQLEQLKRKGITPELIFKENLGVSIKKMPTKITILENNLESQLKGKLTKVEKPVEFKNIFTKLGDEISESVTSTKGSVFSGAESEALEALDKVQKWIWQKSDGGKLTATQANEIKRDLYKQAKPIFTALSRGNDVLPGRQVEAQVKKAVAKGLKEGIEIASGSNEVKILNQRLGNLIEIAPMVERSAQKLQNRQLPVRLGLYEILMATAGFGGGFAHGGALEGLGAAAVAAGATVAPRSATVARGLYSTGKALKPGIANKAAQRVGYKIGEMSDDFIKAYRREK